MLYIKNNTSDMVSQGLDGFCRVNPQVERIKHTTALVLKDLNPDHIPIISGGGSGHEPAHMGYIGEGMLSAAVAGKIFIPPTPKDILETIRRVHQGKGVFVIVKNFEADIEVFYQAIQAARSEGIPVKYIISYDDISVETASFHMRHRGVAGTVFLHKLLGAAAQAGFSLDQLEKLALNASSNIATLGAAFSSATIPGEEKPMFDLAPASISFGIGIHGESGYKTERFESCELLANELVNKLKMHFKWQDGDHYALLLNNLGATTKLEEMVFANDMIQLLELEGLHLDFIKSGHFMTSLNLSGLSVSLFKLEDKAWLDLLNAPTAATAW